MLIPTVTHGVYDRNDNRKYRLVFMLPWNVVYWTIFLNDLIALVFQELLLWRGTSHPLSMCVRRYSEDIRLHNKKKDC